MTEAGESRLDAVGRVLAAAVPDGVPGAAGVPGLTAAVGRGVASWLLGQAADWLRLADLNAPLRTVADFLEIDEDLIAVAAETSPPHREEPTTGLSDWIATLDTAEKDKLLMMVTDGEGPQVQTLLLQRFRGTVNENAPARSARTAAQLWAAAGTRHTRTPLPFLQAGLARRQTPVACLCA